MPTRESGGFVIFMKKLFSFLPVLLLILIGGLVSCSEDDVTVTEPEDTPYYLTEGTVKVFTDEAVSYSIPGDDESEIELNGNIPQEAIPQKGDIICIKPCEKFVSGFVGKVEDINFYNNKYTVSTSVPALTEVFENLSLDIEATADPKELLVLDPEGNKVDVILDDESADDLINGNYSVTSQPISKGGWEHTSSKVYKIYYTTKKEDDDKGFTVEGKMAFSTTTSFSIDINDHHLDYLKFDYNPNFYAGLELKYESERGWEKSGKDAIKLFDVYPYGSKGLTIITPSGIPVIIHPHFTISLECGLKGTATITGKLQWRCGANLGIEKKSRNSDFNPYCKKHDYSESDPLVATEFELSGEAYVGLKTDLSVGFYTKNLSVGATLTGKGKLNADISLDVLNFEVSNPKITVGAYADASIYGKMSFFDNLIKAELRYNLFENFRLFERHTYLFPKYSDFEANASGNAAEVSYMVDPNYLMKFFSGFKRGMAILDSDNNVIKTREDGNTSVTNNSLLSHIHTIDKLASGETYYACPWVKWGAFEWFGEKHEFTTEAAYRIYWRCKGREDIWNLDFTVNSSTTSLYMPFEAATYTGWTKRLLTANYDPSTGILTGTVETDFYDYPSDRRIDGFTVNLNVNDTGYITNTKELDNGGCYTQIRFVKINKDGKAIDMKKIDLGEDECGLGERP